MVKAASFKECQSLSSAEQKQLTTKAMTLTGTKAQKSLALDNGFR